MKLNLIEMLKLGMPVSGILLAMSLISFMLILERLINLSAQFSKDKALFRIARKMGPKDGVSRLVQAAGEGAGPCARVILGIFSSPRDHRAAHMPMELNQERSRLERGMSGLATIASIAPYVGLFGTCIGVIKAFQMISTAQGGGPGVVAGGISEALVNTALGLFVAIPAVLAYNLLAGWVNRHLRDVAWVAQTAISHAGNVEAAPSIEAAPAQVVNLPPRENEFPLRQAVGQNQAQSRPQGARSQVAPHPAFPPPGASPVQQQQTGHMPFGLEEEDFTQRGGR